MKNKQEAILEHLRNHPQATFTEINDVLKLKSLGVVHYHIKELMLQGRLKKVPAKWIVK